MKRFLALVITLAIATLSAFTVFAADFVVTDGALTDISDAINSVQRINTGEYFKGTIIFQNVGIESVSVHSIELKVDSDISVFPFEVVQTNYLQMSDIKVFRKDGSSDYNITDIGTGDKFVYSLLSKNQGLRCRGDAVQGYYDLKFEICCKNSEGDLIPTPVTLPVLIIAESEAPAVGAGVPKIIATSSVTNPNPVVAGEQFTLSVTFQNKSSAATASNVKISLASDGVFNPVSGSSTQYVETLPPGGTKTVSLLLNAKDDAAPGSYNASFNLSYEAAGVVDPIHETEVVAVPVTQIPKIQVGQIQLSSPEIYTGQDLNVMAAVNNTGKSTLYNVNASFSDPSGLLADTSVYLGNIASGGTGNVDVYMTAMQAGDAMVHMTVTYEDEKGNRYDYTDSTSVFVMDKPSFEDYPPYFDEPQIEKQGPSVWLIAGIAAAVIAGVIVFFSIRKKNKIREQKKRDRQDARRIERELAASAEDGNI